VSYGSSLWVSSVPVYTEPVYLEPTYAEPVYAGPIYAEAPPTVIGGDYGTSSTVESYWGGLTTQVPVGAAISELPTEEAEDVGLVPPAASSPSADGAASPDSATAPLEQGDAAFAAGDYAEARRHYVRAQLDGKYAGEAALAYALARFAEGEYTLAALALRRGLSMQPDAIAQPLDVGYFYRGSPALGEHVQRLVEHLAAQPTDGYGWLVLGYVRFGQGDAAGAAEAFGRLTEVDPQDSLGQLLYESAVAADQLLASPNAEPNEAPAPGTQPPAAPEEVPSPQGGSAFVDELPPGLL